MPPSYLYTVIKTSSYMKEVPQITHTVSPELKKTEDTPIDQTSFDRLIASFKLKYIKQALKKVESFKFVSQYSERDGGCKVYEIDGTLNGKKVHGSAWEPDYHLDAENMYYEAIFYYEDDDDIEAFSLRIVVE